jgi:hypothetical protein
MEPHWVFAEAEALMVTLADDNDQSALQLQSQVHRWAQNDQSDLPNLIWRA